MPAPILQTTRLTKHYGSTIGVENLDLTLERGEILGFLGPNGAGKTTTIRMLLNLLRPSSGSFSLFGESVKWGRWCHRSRVGFLPGNLNLPRRMTGRAIIDLLCRVVGKAEREWTLAVAKRLDCNLDSRIRSLSRGNQQKVGLTLALMHRPELLVLDEPSTGLDPLVQREMLDLLREMRDAGTTIFFSSHNISEVEKICDRVALVRHGRLVSTERIEDLRSNRLTSVRVRLHEGQTSPDWRSVRGVLNVATDADLTTITFRGRPGALLTLLSTLDPEEVTWESARLEDHFYAFYEGDAK